MTPVEIDAAPGHQIRRLREERGLRPVDIQRISETVRQWKKCADFGISHATLSDIENLHSVPSVRKMFSLAFCFKLPMEHILALYGASPDDLRERPASETSSELLETRIEVLESPFMVQFDSGFDSRLTGPLFSDIAHTSGLPEPLRSRMDPSTYSYAWVGTHDDAMADLIPGGSLIEIDRNQSTIQTFTWTTIRERPIYFSWTKEGYRCSWCEENDGDLILLPHPASHVRAKCYRRPREASVIGRVTYAWIPFGAATKANNGHSNGVSSVS